jgi:UDP-GlcNAc:undecaprenyl-phosphate GlcNAc-1-phosphate transferase
LASALAAWLVAFVATTLITPAVRHWALRRGVVDQPGGRRVHAQVTPRLGGVALFVGFFAPLSLFALQGTQAMLRFLDTPALVVGLALGATIVMGVGAADDIKGLGPWRKLLAQAVAASVAYAAGYRIDAVNIPGVGDLEMGLLSYPVTLFWFLGVINALNLIDGLDGLAAGIAFLASLTNFIIAYINGAFIVALLSASLAGSLLGFLRYNFNPAKIFMGDSGSMFLGFVLAATSLRGATTKSSTAVAILAPMLALGVPIFDTMLAMIRRTLERRPVFAADRGHIHHRLLDLGLTHRRVVLLLYASSVLLAVAALGVAFGRSWQLGASLLLAGAVMFVLVRAAGAVQRAKRPLATEAERAAALQSLKRRVDKAVAALGACRNYPAVERVLQEFGSDRRLIARVAMRPEQPLGVASSEPEEPGAQAFLYTLHVGGREGAYLEIQLSPSLATVAGDARVQLVRLAMACEEALARLTARQSASQVLVASR